jgi:hypothetical protein
MAIRLRSGSLVSHAMLYTRTEAGIPFIIEAVGSGVSERPLDDALNGASVAAVFRHPRLRNVDAANLVGFARSQIGARYDKWGVLVHPAVGILGDICGVWPQELRERCRNNDAWEVQISADVSKNEFFCSQLVLEAYNQVNMRLTRESPTWSTPGDIPVLAWVNELEYVGHLR